MGRVLKTGNDCKEDRDKEQGRGNPRLYPTLVGKEENMHPKVRVPHVLQGYPGGQYSNLLPKLVQVMSLNLETMSNQKGFQSTDLLFLDGRRKGTHEDEHKEKK